MKKVSVIVPTFNRANYLKVAIESVLKQKYKNLEIIITDNASTDNTIEIVKAFNDERIIYYRNPENIGIARNHNKALELCTGEYIQLFSDDDIMLPECIQKKVDILNRFQSVGLVHSDINIINGAGVITSENHWAKKAWKKWANLHSESKFFPKQEYHKYLYRIRNFISMPSVMIRRSVVNKIGFMNEDLSYIIDWDYWLKITLLEDVYYINEKLISYRLYDSNVYKSITESTYKKELALVRSSIEKGFSKNITIRNTIFQDILQEGGYYTNYNIINPINYLIKNLFPFIPFKKIRNILRI